MKILKIYGTGAFLYGTEGFVVPIKTSEFIKRFEEEGEKFFFEEIEFEGYIKEIEVSIKDFPFIELTNEKKTIVNLVLNEVGACCDYSEYYIELFD